MNFIPRTRYDLRFRIYDRNFRLPRAHDTKYDSQNEAHEEHKYYREFDGALVSTPFRLGSLPAVSSRKEISGILDSSVSFEINTRHWSE